MFGSLSRTATEKAGSARPEEEGLFKPPRQIVSAVPQPIPHPQLSDWTNWNFPVWPVDLYSSPPPPHSASLYRYKTSQQKHTLQKKLPDPDSFLFFLTFDNEQSCWFSSWPRGNVGMRHQSVGQRSPASKSSQRVRDWVQISCRVTARGGGGSSLTCCWTGNFSLTLSTTGFLKSPDWSFKSRS